MSKSVLIIGASRGIGLGFAKAYAADGWEVHATTRTIDKPGPLGRIKSNLTIHNLDIRDGQQIAELGYKLKNGRIDILIHNALGAITLFVMLAPVSYTHLTLPTKA